LFISPLRQNIIQYKYKYRIKISKNNKKKKKPTVPDRRTDKTREYKYKYTRSSKLYDLQWSNPRFIHFRANSLPTSPISMLKSFNLQTHKQTSEQTCTNSDQKIM